MASRTPRGCRGDLCRIGSVFDARILPQILPWLPASDGIDVHLLAASPLGVGVTLKMNKTGCSWVVLDGRE